MEKIKKSDLVKNGFGYEEHKPVSLRREYALVSEGYKKLKETLFKSTLGYLDGYHYASSLEDKNWYRQKFIALYSVIEDAELEDEYFEWKEEHGDE